MTTGASVPSSTTPLSASSCSSARRRTKRPCGYAGRRTAATARPPTAWVCCLRGRASCTTRSTGRGRPSRTPTRRSRGRPRRGSGSSPGPTPGLPGGAPRTPPGPPPGPAAAGDGPADPDRWREFERSFPPKDDPRAEEEWRRRASAGDAMAAYQLGNRVWFGRGDANEATRWYRMAVDGGHVGASYELSLLVDDRTYAERLRAYAAQRGHPGAAVAMGEALRDRGQIAAATRWFEWVVRDGHPGAAPEAEVQLRRIEMGPDAEAGEHTSDEAFQLGLRFDDYEEGAEHLAAQDWFRQAAKKGHT